MSIDRASFSLLGTRDFFTRTQALWLDMKDEGAPLDEHVLRMPTGFSGQLVIKNPGNNVVEKVIKVRDDVSPDFEQNIGPINSRVYVTLALNNPVLLSRLKEEISNFIDTTE